MKKFSSIILSLILFFTTLPLNAQDVVPVISREDLKHYDQVNTTINKDLNKTITFDNPHAVYEEFKQILKYKSEQAFKDYKKNPGKTYSEKQTAWNMAFFPIIGKEEKYPKSKYFQEPYQLYAYALETYYTNIMEPEAQRIGNKEYRNKARKHIAQIIQKRSQGDNFFANTKVTEEKNPMNEAGYLVAYASQINSFYNEVQELKYRKKTCEHPKLYGIEDVDNDVDCQRALALADDYNLSIIQGGAFRIGSFASIAAEELEKCLRDVLFQLQTPFIPFEEVEDFLKHKSDLSYVDSDGNVHTSPESTWQSCGMSKKDLIQIIADNSMTREEAKQSLKKGIGGKILQGLDYISFSYWQDRATRADEFENYIISKFGEEKMEELKEEGNEKEEREIAERMAESYNAVLSAIATDLIAYGKIFYYHNDVNLVFINDDHNPADASSKFARTWYKMGTDRTQESSPIAKLARGAIMQAGGKARNLQDNLFVKTMYEAQVESNIKTNVMILSLAADFVDPIMALAPLKEIKGGVKLLKLGAKYAPKTTRTVYNASKQAGKTINVAKTAIADSKVGRGVSQVSRGVKKATEPVRQLKSKTGKLLYDAADDWSDIGRYASRGTDATGTLNKAGDVTDIARNADDITDATKITAKNAPTSPAKPKTTATDPEKLGLTSEFDETLAKAGGNDIPPTRIGAGFYKQELPMGQTTASGAPEGMRRQIGFGNEGNYIPESAGIRDPNGPGVQNVTKGTPGQRVPEGPTASGNRYDVRNQAGGTPDTPGTPQQDLSGLNKQISTTPPHQTTPLTKQEADDLFKQRQRQRENHPWKREEKNWELRDEELSGTVKVERSGYGEWKITKADGSTRIATREEFETWINGVPGVEGCNISQKERDAIKGLDKFSDPYETRMDKRWQDIDRKRDRRSYTDAEWTHDKEGIKREEKFHGTVKVEISGTTQSGTIPKNRTVTITKADGTTYRTNLDEFERWINDNDFPISQKEKDAIKGLDDILDAKKRTQQMDKLFSGKGQLPAQIAYRPQGIKNSLNSGCSDFKSCKQLVDYLIDSRKTVHEETSSLLSLYAKETGNNNVDDMYKSLLDFFERRGQNEGYDYLNSFLNDNSLRNFLFNNGSVSGFDKIADNMLPALKWQDLAKVLKSDTPENLKTLRQLATDDDWKYVISKSQELIGKRRAYFIEQYEDALLDIERIAPKAAEDIRHGKVPHSVTLTKAGVDKQKAQNVAYWYHSIKQIDAILK